MCWSIATPAYHAGNAESFSCMLSCRICMVEAPADLAMLLAALICRCGWHRRAQQCRHAMSFRCWPSTETSEATLAHNAVTCTPACSCRSQRGRAIASMYPCFTFASCALCALLPQAPGRAIHAPPGAGGGQAAPPRRQDAAAGVAPSAGARKEQQAVHVCAY